ncbi:MAG: hypothetical protein ACK4UJ_03215 [Leptonema sp. (in: bacteria)]
MSTSAFVILGLALGILSFLFWLAIDLQFKNTSYKQEKKGYCPICNHILLKGEKIRSDQLETPKVEIKTFIKGCPYCLEKNEKRICPICKRKLNKNQTILAVANFDDPTKLSIKGCKQCYSQGYMGYESKYQ